jgi:uncharacterized protein (DUF433 family)
MSRVEVVLDPEVMSGDPCISGTRVPAGTIVSNPRAGYRTHHQSLSDPEGGIEAAIRWAESAGIDWWH